MEVWVDLRQDETPVITQGVDRWLVNTPLKQQEVAIEQDFLSDSDGLLGGYYLIADGESQNKCKAAIGSADWVLVECQTWSMIPLENLIAAKQGSPTKIAAMITTALQAQGAGFALEQGVDALVVPNSKLLIEAALITKSQRLELTENRVKDVQTPTESYSLEEFVIQSVEDGGVGDRYCLDFTSLLEAGEGVLIGSSSSQMLLVHSETLLSSFVPTRPFRVNAGSPHSYILMGDGTTKYMSELNSGDEILIMHESGRSRVAVLGRIKIEQRPMLKLKFRLLKNYKQNPNEGHVYMQQAETVRLVGPNETRHSVTELKLHTTVLGWHGGGGRHIGVAIGSSVKEL
tara:strand:- start:1419 stop:2453 length:1035 start_codon:yes stop_codon:yes gene_type:complete